MFFLAIKNLIYYPDSFNRERDRGLLLNFSHFHISLKHYRSGKPAKIKCTVLCGLNIKVQRGQIWKIFLYHQKLLFEKMQYLHVFQAQPCAGNWKRDKPGEQNDCRASLRLLGSMLAAHCCCRIKMSVFLCAIPVPSQQPEGKGCSFVRSTLSWTSIEESDGAEQRV